MIEAKDWVWFGRPGHFICAHWCRFHMMTVIGDILVSTVGLYVHPRHSGGSELREFEYLKENPDGDDVGYNRKYETMVFKTGKPCSSKGCDCGQPTIDGYELDADGYNTTGAATAGHRAMCLKWAALDGKVPPKEGA